MLLFPVTAAEFGALHFHLNLLLQSTQQVITTEASTLSWTLKNNNTVEAT